MRKISLRRFLAVHTAAAKDTASCQKWMNQYPTLFLTFKDVDGLNFDDAYGQLAAQIADLYKEHAYLLD